MTCNAHYVANEGEGRPFCRVAMNQAATIEAAQIENHVPGSQQTAGLGCIGGSSPGLRHLLPCLTQPGSTNTLGDSVFFALCAQDRSNPQRWGLKPRTGDQ